MQVDFLILADGAQVAGDKVYILGGGWTIVWAREFPTTHRGSVAVGMLVDWMETNQQHQLEVVLLSDDGQQVGEPLVSGKFEVGKPPGITPGVSQRFMVAAGADFPLAKAGMYSVVVRIDGSDVSRTSFNAVQAAG